MLTALSTLKSRLSIPDSYAPNDALLTSPATAAGHYDPNGPVFLHLAFSISRNSGLRQLSILNTFCRRTGTRTIVFAYGNDR